MARFSFHFSLLKMSEPDFHFTFHFSNFQYPLSQDTVRVLSIKGVSEEYLRSSTEYETVCDYDDNDEDDRNDHENNDDDNDDDDNNDDDDLQ